VFTAPQRRWSRPESPQPSRGAGGRGVDRARYMKSTSGKTVKLHADGSFAIGTNPDINTVNVNNRRSGQRCRKCPLRAAAGLVVQKNVGDPSVHVLYSANGEQDLCSSPTTPSSTCSMRFPETAGVGQASCSRNCGLGQMTHRHSLGAES